MRYSEKLSELVLSLKGGVFFLSPRERAFLDMLEDMGIPLRVVIEGIRDCYVALPPGRRSKYPLFMCFKYVMKRYEDFLRIEAQKLELNWRDRFLKKLSLVKNLVTEEVPAPKSEEEAERTLRDIEAKILKGLWRKLSPQEKERIREKYKDFKDNQEIFGELIKSELRRIYGIPHLSIYVD